MEALVKFYHQMGLQQKEILSALHDIHAMFISDRQLKRILRSLGLFRRKRYSDVVDVADFLQEQISNHNQMHGYKWMHLKCLQNNFIVTQDTVRRLLKILDPVSVETRTRRRLQRRQYFNKGPNYLWHIDCYDKLKPFGVCINGCIDGFSRYILWLKAGQNTNDPSLIAYYYLDYIKSIGGCPQTLRADMGTENASVRDLQRYFRRNYDETQNTLPPFLYGTSPANQRIEAWWAILRKHHSQFWMNVFHELKENGLFNGFMLDKGLIRFCFLRIIQEELDLVVQEWNFHRISSSRNGRSPAGRPFIMYHNPEVYGSNNYRYIIDNDDLLLEDISTKPSNVPCDQDLCELCLIIMDENGWNMPKTADDGIELYINLRAKATELLNID